MPVRLTPSTCCEYGHTYVQVFLKRCPHLQGWHLEVTAFRDDADSTTVLYEHVVGFGPFDDELAPIDALVSPFREAVLALLEAELPDGPPWTPTLRRGRPVAGEQLEV